MLGLAVIAGWVVTLTVGFNYAMHVRLGHERDAVLRNRAVTVATTVTISDAGAISVTDHPHDESLDSGIWVFSKTAAVARPAAAEPLQRMARSLADAGRRYGSIAGYRFYAEPLNRGDHQVGTVVASTSTAPYDHALDESLEGSAIVAALMLVGAYPVLRFAAGRALRPVDTMTRQAGDWSAHGLNERFGSDQRFREVQLLARTLDGVLDRLAAVVRHERRFPAELSHELRTPSVAHRRRSRSVGESDLPHPRSICCGTRYSAERDVHEPDTGDPARRGSLGRSRGAGQV